MNTTWSASSKLKGRGGVLKDPDGHVVAHFKDYVISLQCAAAMNLTTTAQRVAYLAEKAGFQKAVP